jgi:putative transposon-encoded protein
MKRVHMKPQTEISVKGVIGFFVKKVTPFGTGAKVDCPKEFLGKKVYLIICENE